MRAKPVVACVVAGAAAVFAIVIPTAPGKPADRSQVSETLELVNVEIVRGTFFPELWQITETSARLDTPQYSHEHSWTLPSTIPPGGAPATINVSATDKSGGRIYASTVLFGYINVDVDAGGAEVSALADKVAGSPTASATKTVTLTPRGGSDANGMVLVTIRILDGPDIRFNYRVVTAPAPAPLPAPPSPGAGTQPGGSCGRFGTFDPANPPGTVRLEPGDAISYSLDPGDATLRKDATWILWGDRTSDRLRADLTRPDTFEFVHIYYESGTYRVRLRVVGTLGAACRNDVRIGTVVIPQPTAPLVPAVAARKCDDFLRKASGRVGRIVRSATRQPRTQCGRARRLSRTCTTTVVDRRRCNCRYTIKTRVPASGKPKVLKVSRRRA